MTSFPEVFLDRIFEFHPGGIRRVVLLVAAEAPTPDRVAVASKVWPGIAMNAFSGFDPMGASTTT
jgi:hypothetical protein